MKKTKIISSEIELPDNIEIEIINKQKIFPKQINEKLLDRILQETKLLKINNIYFFYNTAGFYNKKFIKYLNKIKSLNLNYKQNINNKIPCNELFNTIKITYDGFIVSCFYNPYFIANLKDYSLFDAWNHPKFINLRNQHIKEKILNKNCINCLK